MKFASIPPIRDDEFERFRRLVRREAGISLLPHKRLLLVTRLYPRMRALGIRTFTEYYENVMSPGGRAELVRMLDCISTNETTFFRERAQFDLLEGEICAGWADEGARQIRIWSAACSTGEEPYSVAMSLLAHLPSDVLSVEILASDLSTRALEHARQGVYPIERAAEIPELYLYAFMLEGSGAQRGKMRIGPEAQGLVRFCRMNLNEEPHPAPGLFDLILCRNVLIYFDAETRAAVLSRLFRCLKPRGYLFLGHAESLIHANDRLETVMPAVYRSR